VQVWATIAGAALPHVLQGAAEPQLLQPALVPQLLHELPPHELHDEAQLSPQPWPRLRSPPLASAATGASRTAPIEHKAIEANKNRIFIQPLL
jgi:hypothetical protein